MKILKLLATVLLVALCTGFYSCSKEVDDKSSSTVDEGVFFPIFETYYKNSANVTCKAAFYAKGNVLSGIKDSIVLSGIKNKHLWYAYYNEKSKEQVFEWEDLAETDSVIERHIGYGEYNIDYIKYVIPYQYKKTSGGSIVFFKFSYENNGHVNLDLELGRFTFIYYGSSKKISLERKSLGPNLNIEDWYKESVFIDNCCYSYEGDTIYVAKQKPLFIDGKLEQTELVSYEEGIRAWGSSISKFNFKEGKYIWRTSTAPFEVPNDARWKYTLLSSSTNIWKYKVDITFYDGTKKDYTFSINIDNGKVQ